MDLVQTSVMDLQQSLQLKIDAVIKHRKAILDLKHQATDLDLKCKESLSLIVENMNHLVPKELEMVMHGKFRNLEEILIFLIDQRLNKTDKQIAIIIGAYQIYGFDSWHTAFESIKLLKDAWDNILNVEIERFDDRLRVIFTLPEKS